MHTFCACIRVGECMGVCVCAFFCVWGGGRQEMWHLHLHAHAQGKGHVLPPCDTHICCPGCRAAIYMCAFLPPPPTRLALAPGTWCCPHAVLQGEDGDVRWVMFMLGFWVLLAMSIVGFCVSLMWIAQIIVYMVPPSPLNPLLNNMFVAMDDVFPLFGTLMFGLFSLYLMAVAMKVCGCIFVNSIVSVSGH